MRIKIMSGVLTVIACFAEKLSELIMLRFSYFDNGLVGCSAMIRSRSGTTCDKALKRHLGETVCWYCSMRRVSENPAGAENAFQVLLIPARLLRSVIFYVFAGGRGKEINLLQGIFRTNRTRRFGAARINHESAVERATSNQKRITHFRSIAQGRKRTNQLRTEANAELHDRSVGSSR